MLFFCHNLDWFHFLFTWKDQTDNRASLDPMHGLKVYIDGELKLSTLQSELIRINKKKTISPKDLRAQHRRRQAIVDERDVHKMTFGQVGPLREMKLAGKFQFGHLAIWRKALGQDEVDRVFKVNVRHKTQRDKFCCAEKKIKGIKQKQFK
jgi:hypothetical protein